MTITCPCCRASNTAGPACRRCKADLSPLFDLEMRRSYVIERARRAAREDRYPDALGHLDEAAGLRPGDEVARLRAAVLLLAGEYAAALAAYHGLSHPRAEA